MRSLTTKSSRDKLSSGTLHLVRSAATSDEVTLYFVLTFFLATPLYVLSTLAGLRILGQPQLAAVYIAIATLEPMLAASILQTRLAQDSLRELYARCLYVHRDKPLWYVVAILLGPLTAGLSYGAVKVWSENDGDDVMSTKIPPPVVPTNMQTVPATIVFMCVMATCEEVGWMGYAFDRMQSQKGGALPAAIQLGVLWACWHLPFFFVLFPEPQYITIPSQALTLVADRVLECWIYNNTNGSVLAVIAHHTIDNVTFVLLPDIRSATPVGPIAECVVSLGFASVVVFLWDSQTFVQYRFLRE